MVQPTAMESPRSLVVKLTAGIAEAERCNQAVTVAATAATAGVPVSLWLTGEATWLAIPGRAAQFDLPHAVPMVELLDTVLSTGQVTVCTQCAERRGITVGQVIAGVRIAGSAAYVEEIMRPEAQAIVY